jgi:hypothetical protein
LLTDLLEIGEQPESHETVEGDQKPFENLPDWAKFPDFSADDLHRFRFHTYA